MVDFHKVISKFLRLIRIDFLLLFFGKNSYLKKTGWLKSSFTKSCINQNSEPLPWWTFSAIKFLDKKIDKSLNVFEFGAGYSTIWLSKRAKNVIAIEDNLNWIKALKPMLGINARIIYSETENVKYGNKTFLSLNEDKYNYSKEILKFDYKFDIIIIDGVDRNNCIKTSISRLSPEGVIIVDNLELSDLMSEGISLIKLDGFKLLDFWGLSPGISHETGTGIFYKPKNCLNI